MTCESQTLERRAKLEELGQRHNIPLYCEVAVRKNGSYPLVALSADTDIPTEEELQLIAQDTKNRAALFGADSQRTFMAQGQHTRIFKKGYGGWKFRSTDWADQGIWTISASLEKLLKTK